MINHEKIFLSQEILGAHVHLSKCWRGTCLSFKMLKGTFSTVTLLKGYMVSERMRTPALE